MQLRFQGAPVQPGRFLYAVMDTMTVRRGCQASAIFFLSRVAGRSRPPDRSYSINTGSRKIRSMALRAEAARRG